MSANLTDKIHKIITAKNGKMQSSTPDVKKSASSKNRLIDGYAPVPKHN